jgi:hypothetical protein
MLGKSRKNKMTKIAEKYEKNMKEKRKKYYKNASN